MTGAYMPRGVHGRGCAWWGGHVWQGLGVHVWQMACMAGGVIAGEMATEVGGMYPTGMHSCFSKFQILSRLINQNILEKV